MVNFTLDASSEKKVTVTRSGWARQIVMLSRVIVRVVRVIVTKEDKVSDWLYLATIINGLMGKGVSMSK
jgi:hypothetical protein